MCCEYEILNTMQTQMQHESRQNKTNQREGDRRRVLGETEKLQKHKWMSYFKKQSSVLSFSVLASYRFMLRNEDRRVKGVRRVSWVLKKEILASCHEGFAIRRGFTTVGLPAPSHVAILSAYEIFPAFPDSPSLLDFLHFSNITELSKDQLRLA